MDKKTLEPLWDRLPVEQALTVIGAQLDEDACGPQARFAGVASAGPGTWHQGVVCPLPDLGLVRVTGEDGARFLHAQMTNEVEKQPPGQVALNGYCSAKGRLLATAWQWRGPEAIHLLVARGLAAPLARRLSMFVLRSKAKVQDVAPGYLCFGLAGERAASALQALGLAVPAEGVVLEQPDGLVAIAQPAVSLAGTSLRRVLLVVPTARLSQVWPVLLSQLHPVDSARWRWSDVLTGIGRVTPLVSEHFVPQMINFDLTGGVSFKKGCYPGQEVVARSHYLGKLKRRSFLGRIGAASPVPDPGQDVFGNEGDAPCGEVVLAGIDPLGTTLVMFESQIAQAGVARIGADPLDAIPLPYALPAVEPVA
jgi:folate-binding protein YgfZ